MRLFIKMPFDTSKFDKMTSLYNFFLRWKAMEYYEYFCAISKYLYKELEEAASMAYVLKQNNLDSSEWDARKEDLKQRINEHLEDFDYALLMKGV